MQGGQSFNILDEGRRNEVAGKVEIFNCAEEIFYSCDEHLCNFSVALGGGGVTSVSGNHATVSVTREADVAVTKT